MTNNIKFGVNILEHLKNQVKDTNLPENQKQDLQGLIKHLEEGKGYETYQVPGEKS